MTFFAFFILVCLKIVIHYNYRLTHNRTTRHHIEKFIVKIRQIDLLKIFPCFVFGYIDSLSLCKFKQFICAFTVFAFSIISGVKFFIAFSF